MFPSSTSRREALLRQLEEIDRIDALYPPADPHPNGTVMRFRASFDDQGNRRTYTYIAYKRKGRWYLTGFALRGGWTWEALRAWFAEHSARDFETYSRGSHKWDPTKITDDDRRTIIEYLRNLGYVVRMPDEPRTGSVVRTQHPEGAPPADAPRCTHGGDCPAHPEARGLHDCGQIAGEGWAAGPTARSATALIAQAHSITEAFNRRSGDPAARGAMDSPDLFQDMCAVYGAQMTYRPILDRIFQAASRAAAARATVGNRDVEIWIHAKARFDRLYHPATSRDPEEQHAELDADGVDPRSGS